MSGRKPNWIVFQILERKGKSDFFRELGAGWNNKDGSINVQLTASPMDGRIHLQAFPESPKVAEKNGEQGEGF